MGTCAVEVLHGKIKSIVPLDAKHDYQHADMMVLDCGNAILSPGLIDTHVHMDEPGREHWEGESPRLYVELVVANGISASDQSGSNCFKYCFDCKVADFLCARAGFKTGTQAAAAGGVTTVIDMPLNNVPATTTGDLVLHKLHASEVCSSVHLTGWLLFCTH